jgi:hypothetical protein
MCIIAARVRDGPTEASHSATEFVQSHMFSQGDTAAAQGQVGARGMQDAST